MHEFSWISLAPALVWTIFGSCWFWWVLFQEFKPYWERTDSLGTDFAEVGYCILPVWVGDVNFNLLVLRIWEQSR